MENDITERQMKEEVKKEQVKHDEGEEEEEEEEENQIFRDEADEKTAAPEFTCFEEVLELVGTSGRWNICLFVLCGACLIPCAFSSMSYQFLGATPDYWCHIEILTEANWTQEQIKHLAIPYSNQTGQHSGCSMYDYNYTKAALLGYDEALARLNDLTDKGGAPEVVPCNVRDFNQTQHESSIVTEWDLVCERRVLYATTQAVNQFGFLVGGAITPIFTDAFGRRPAILSLIILSLVFGLSSCLVSSAEMFIGLKWGLSLAVNSVYICCFLIMMEMCSQSTRSSFGTMIVSFWALGVMILPGVAYLIRSWRHLQAALMLPSGVMVVHFWLLPESPRWLLLRGRYKDAEETLTRIADANHRQIPHRQVFLASLKRISRQMAAEMGGQGEDREMGRGCLRRMAAALRHLVSPYSTAALARRMGTLIVLWFSVSFVYYGVALNATNISADPYLYLFLGGLSEVPAYLLLWQLVARAGRRPSLSGLYLLCAVCIATNAALMFNTPDIHMVAKISLSLIGKMSIAAAFHLLYLYTAELFTTRQRSLALSHNALCSRFGSIMSPYVNDLLGESAPWAPSAAFSGMAFLSASLSFLLPETRIQNLPEDDQPIVAVAITQGDSGKAQTDAPNNC